MSIALDYLQQKQRTEQTVKPVAKKSYRRASITFLVLRFLVGWLVRFLFKVEVRGKENLPRRGGYILAANHLGWFDPFFMLVALPAEPRIHFMAAKENMRRNRLRQFITEQIGGVIPVERGTGNGYRAVVHSVSKVLQGGGVLGIYPEGTVSATETGKLLPFKKGVGHFAIGGGCPIVPVALSGTKELWFRKHVIMVIGEPIYPQPTDSPLSLTNATATAITEILPPVRNHDGELKLFKDVLTDLFK
jgi:1-acyl-sn-glycerol-3-phosphate acyltransferase